MSRDALVAWIASARLDAVLADAAAYVGEAALRGEPRALDLATQLNELLLELRSRRELAD